MFPNLSRKPQSSRRSDFGVAKAKSRPLNAVARGLAFLVIQDTQAMVVFVAREGRAVRGGGTVKPGKSWRRKAKAFKKRGAERALGRSAFHDLGHDKPWHPVTNYPQMRGVKHVMSAWAELTFRDWKSGSWQ